MPVDYGPPPLLPSGSDSLGDARRRAYLLQRAQLACRLLVIVLRDGLAQKAVGNTHRRRKS
jgi:hypothetical protein